MIKVFLKLKEPLIYINRNTTNVEFNYLFLNDIDWRILIELQRIFEIFVKPSITL
jgi:uncharacterized integral membrane protein